MARRNSLLVSRTLYQLGVVTLIVSLIWLGSGVYYALNTQVATSTTVDKKILEPINPVIDKEVITALSNRLVINPTEASPSANINGDNTE